MELDATRCYQAVLSRDRRFDGRFFSGVVTTGIYCRPICPVHPPKPQNVRWFACAAAAEAAGFRPCRRCRPETSPGTPAWVGTSAVVSRALRLIAAGALDEENIDALAARLGIGARQLRRLFAEHLGASPLAVARARRVHFAVKLIEETPLPITTVAFSAGFNSIRQFNHAVRSTFGRPPTALRRRLNGSPPSSTSVADGAGLEVRLPYRPPLAWPDLLAFLALRAIPGVEETENNVYRRTIELDGAAGTVEVRAVPGESYLLMNVTLPSSEGLIQVVERVRRIFDLGADPLLIEQQLRHSPQLRRLVAARPGVRVPGAWDAFELAIRAILGQQVSVRGASTLAGRLVQAYGTPVALNGNRRLTHLFPRPETLADADLSDVGLTRARAETIRALAVAVRDGHLRFDAEQELEDTVAHLCAIPGIGAWTAHYIAMRGCGEPDAFPSGDLGLRRAAGSGGTPMSEHELKRLADTWRPWRAYAAMHLWTSLSSRTGKCRDGR